MSEKTICETLDRALVTEEEFALGPEAWSAWTKLVTTEVPDDEGDVEDEPVRRRVEGESAHKARRFH